MGGEETVVLAVQIACYVEKILELRVVTRTQSFKVGLCHNLRKSCCHQHSQYGTGETDEYLLHIVVVLYHQDKQHYVQRHPRPSIGDSQGEMV